MRGRWRWRRLLLLLSDASCNTPRRPPLRLKGGGVAREQKQACFIRARARATLAAIGGTETRARARRRDALSGRVRTTTALTFSARVSGLFRRFRTTCDVCMGFVSNLVGSVEAARAQDDRVLGLGDSADTAPFPQKNNHTPHLEALDQVGVDIRKVRVSLEARKRHRGGHGGVLGPQPRSASVAAVPCDVDARGAVMG